MILILAFFVALVGGDIDICFLLFLHWVLSN